MNSTEINWQYFEDLARRLNEPKVGPRGVEGEEIQKIGSVANELAARQDWETLLRFARLFFPVIEGESISIDEVLHGLVEKAITAAENLNDVNTLAYLWYAEGHNLHRQGSHEAALAAFVRSYQDFDRAGDSLSAKKSYYMTALCLRALSRVEEAKAVLNQVLSETAPDDPWRANPLSIQGWIARDENQLGEAEQLLREALTFAASHSEDEILTASIYADLAEVVGLQGRATEAHQLFQNSLRILEKYEGLYNRQVARVKVKEAELELREANFDQAVRLLNQADTLISSYGVFRDLLWKIEMLKAMIFVRQKNYGAAMRKMRAAKDLYQEMGLPLEEFYKQIINRLKLGAGIKKPEEISSTPTSKD